MKLYILHFYIFRCSLFLYFCIFIFKDFQEKAAAMITAEADDDELDDLPGNSTSKIESETESEFSDSDEEDLADSVFGAGIVCH